MKRAELNRRCRAVLYYSSIVNERFHANSMVAPINRAHEYAEHMGLEVREVFRSKTVDRSEAWAALLERVQRRKEKHILLPDARCIADAMQWEALVGRARRAGAVLHFFYWGVVFHEASSLKDLPPSKDMPIWLHHLRDAEIMVERLEARERREAQRSRR